MLLVMAGHRTRMSRTSSESGIFVVVLVAVSWITNSALSGSCGKGSSSYTRKRLSVDHAKLAPYASRPCGVVLACLTVNWRENIDDTPVTASQYVSRRRRAAALASQCK